MRALSLWLMLASGVISGCGVIDCSSPETKLRGEFEAKLAVLERLRRMSDEDSRVIRIAPTFTRLEDDWSWPRPPEKLGFSEQRWNEYRRLFREAGVSAGIDRDSGYTFLTTKTCGLAVSGKSYGYAFAREKPKQMLPSLDAFSLPNGVGFVPVKGDWYLFVWVT